MSIKEGLKFEAEKKLVEILELGEQLLDSRILVLEDGFEIIAPNQKTLVMVTFSPKMFAFVVKGLMGFWSLFGQASKTRGANFVYLRIFLGRLNKEIRL